MKKIVIFSQRVEVIEAYNERRDCADQRISEFISQCGYIPVPVPNRPEDIESYIETIKPVGIVLTGGNSLVKYGGNAQEKDDTDSRLIEIAIRDTIPLYGFCRGMQSILDYFGNELVNVQGHVAVRHVISGTEDNTEVNSYHNQGCIKLDTDELETLMKTDDGVIEKIRHKSFPIVGTMWHPERETPFAKSDIELIQKLFDRKDIC